MNHFCYNSLFGFSEKELEKMENNHRMQRHTKTLCRVMFSGIYHADLSLRAM